MADLDHVDIATWIGGLPDKLAVGVEVCGGRGLADTQAHEDLIGKHVFNDVCRALRVRYGLVATNLHRPLRTHHMGCLGFIAHGKVEDAEDVAVVCLGLG